MRIRQIIVSAVLLGHAAVADVRLASRIGEPSATNGNLGIVSFRDDESPTSAIAATVRFVPDQTVALSTVELIAYRAGAGSFACANFYVQVWDSEQELSLHPWQGNAGVAWIGVLPDDQIVSWGVAHDGSPTFKISMDVRSSVEIILHAGQEYYLAVQPFVNECGSFRVSGSDYSADDVTTPDVWASWSTPGETHPLAPGDSTGELGVFAYDVWGGPPCNSGCPDFDESGAVDLTDLSLLLSDFGGAPSELCVDIDGSGSVDLGDLAQFLSAFGASCP